MTKRPLTRIKNLEAQNINYDIWLKSCNDKRKQYLRNVGVSDKKKIETLIHLQFNILPYDIRTNLQVKPVIKKGAILEQVH